MRYTHIFALILLSRGLPAQREPTEQVVIDRVVHDLCDKRVALLGEPSTHGYGKTFEFKTAIVRRLVEQCGFDTFLIETGTYDFLNIAWRLKSGRTVSDSMLTAALGLWANRDVEPLVPFLMARARTGRLVLGGIDDQIGRGTWAQLGMTEVATGYLTGSDSAECRSALQKHMFWRYAPDAPFGRADGDHILSCVSKIESALSGSSDRLAREYLLPMIENLRRTTARAIDDGLQPGVDAKTFQYNARDSSMYLNFRWWASRAGRPRKTIVWTATIHASKNLVGVPGNETLISMGSRIRRDFGDAAFVLGFSAYSGRYRLMRQPEHALSIAPDSTLEGALFTRAGADVRYLDPSALRRLGTVAARPLGADFTAANWPEVIDGLVVFRDERPPRL